MGQPESKREERLALFLISYDLVKGPDAFDYEPLWAALRETGAVQAQTSVWHVDLNNTAGEVYKHFVPLIDGDDRLMVVEFSKRPVWANALPGTPGWINARLPWNA